LEKFILLLLILHPDFLKNKITNEFDRSFMLNSGSYQIYFYLAHTQKLEIGKLGECIFQQGNYVYTGSAMKNLRQRVARHLSFDKKIKWHIDYLLNLDSCKITKVEIFYSDEREECVRNLRILESGKASVPIKRFGSSDCRNCPSHLLLLK